MSCTFNSIYIQIFTLNYAPSWFHIIRIISHKCINFINFNLYNYFFYFICNIFSSMAGFGFYGLVKQQCLFYWNDIINVALSVYVGLAICIYSNARGFINFFSYIILNIDKFCVQETTWQQFSSRKFIREAQFFYEIFPVRIFGHG